MHTLHTAFRQQGRRALLASAVLALTASPAASAPFTVHTFSPWAGYSIPNGRWVTGDFNGDRRMDILHAVQGADYTHVWTSRGDGTFTVSGFRPWAGYGVTNGELLTGDFNGDGRTDVIHPVPSTDYVHTWLSNGNGTFAVGSFRPWAGYSIPNGQWLTGDFNGDGRTDVVHAVQGADYVHLWTSRGDGTFTVGSFRPWAGYGMPNGRWLVGDFNGDRRADILHPVPNTDFAHVWTSRGDGTFAVGTFRPWAGYAIPNGEWHTGDFNGDGRTDILHPVNGADYAHAWTSNGNGTFAVSTFRPWSGYGIPNGRWLVADFDGDARADVVHAVQGTSYAHVWRARGDGTFHVTRFSPWAGYAIPNGLWMSGDLTGDGRADIVHAVQGSATVHPWISRLPKPGEVSLDGLEVTQGIQDAANGVPLVAQKPGWLRAYLSTRSTAPVTVRGTLNVRNLVTGVVTAIPSSNTASLNPADLDVLRVKRESLAGGLNFILPPQLLAAGRYEYRLAGVTNAASGAAIACSDCGTTPASSVITASAPLRLRVVGLRYVDSTRTPAAAFAPRAVDFNLLESWLRRAYPIGQLVSSRVTVDANSRWPFGCGDANAQLAALRATDVAAGMDARTYYYGMVSDGGGFMRGCAAGIPGGADPTVVSSGPTGPGDFGWDSDGTYGDWYGGHEIGHTLGRFHLGSGCGESSDDSSYPFTAGQLSNADGAHVGLDVGDTGNGLAAAALPGVSWHDVMTYCQRQWLSNYTYTRIRDRLNAVDALTAGAGGGMAMESGAGIDIPGGGVRHAGADTLPVRIAPAAAQVRAAAAPVTGRSTPPAVRGGGAAPQVPAPAMAAPSIPSPAAAAPSARTGHAAPPRVQVGAADTLPLAERAALVRERPQVSLSSGDYISLVGTVNLTRGTGDIRFASRVPRALVPTAQRQGERTEVRLLGEGGQVLASHPVWLRENTDIPAGEDRTGLVDAVLPFRNGIKTLALVLDGKVVATRQVSRNAPGRGPGQKGLRAMQALAPGRLSYTWDAADPDGDPLTYTVQISRDAGRSWEAIAVGLARREITVDPETVRGPGGFLLRVIANDGFNSTIVSTETFTPPA